MKIEAIENMRIDHDLKRADVARILKISQQYYSRYEKGEIEIPARHLIALAKYYDVSLEYLCGLVPTPEALSERLRAKTRTKRIPSKEEIHTAYLAAPTSIQEAIQKLLKI